MSRRQAHPPSAGPSQRQLRVGEVLRHALADILRARDIRDPDARGVSVTVTEVKPSPDMRHATVFVEPLGGKNADSHRGGAQPHRRFLRGELGRTIELQFTPELRFVEDTSFDGGPAHRAILHSGSGARPGKPRRRGRGEGEDAVARLAFAVATTSHGWLILDKPIGMTSTHAVAAVKRLFDAQKAGHAGTLDPLATGSCRGARRGHQDRPLSPWTARSSTLHPRWGEARDTDDAEGEVDRDVRPAADGGRDLGRFSALHRRDPADARPPIRPSRSKGERAYDLAREGEEVELAAREIADRIASSWSSTDRDHADVRGPAAKAPMSGPGCAILPWRSARSAMCRRCAG